MATTAQDNVVIRLIDPLPFAIMTDGTALVNQGDQVYLDTSAHVVKPLGSSDDTNAASFVGVAGDSSVTQPYSTAFYGSGSGQIPVFQKGVFRFNSTSGDTYTAGNKVYVGADAQTVTNTAGGNTKILGIIVMPAGVTSISGATGTTVQVAIEIQWPVASY